MSQIKRIALEPARAGVGPLDCGSNPSCSSWRGDFARLEHALLLIVVLTLAVWLSGCATSRESDLAKQALWCTPTAKTCTVRVLGDRALLTQLNAVDIKHCHTNSGLFALQQTERTNADFLYFPCDESSPMQIDLTVDDDARLAVVRTAMRILHANGERGPWRTPQCRAGVPLDLTNDAELEATLFSTFYPDDPRVRSRESWAQLCGSAELVQKHQSTVGEDKTEPCIQNSQTRGIFDLRPIGTHEADVLFYRSCEDWPLVYHIESQTDFHLAVVQTVIEKIREMRPGEATFQWGNKNCVLTLSLKPEDQSIAEIVLLSHFFSYRDPRAVDVTPLCRRL